MRSSSKYLNETVKEYALYAGENRAIPKVTDGLKNAARQALWVIRKEPGKIKTLALSGAMIAENLYVHGDASGAIGSMAAPFLNNVPLLFGDGQFGNRVDPGAIGAPRYTYVKANRATEVLVYPDISIIPLKENYDGSNVEPVTFLPIIPLVLLNGVSGIAMGWSTEILPRSMDDLITATIQAIDKKPITKLVPKYTFTNCTAKELAPNSWEFSGVVEFVDTSTIRVKELPPGLLLEKFRERLDGLEEEGVIRDYIDSSTEEIDLLIKFKKGSVDKNKMSDYIDLLKLRSKNTERIVVIDFDFKSIKQYASAEEIVQKFVEWRFGHYIRRYEKFFDDDSKELQYWKGIKACFDNGLPALVPTLQNKQEIVKKIVDFTVGLTLDAGQIDTIASFPTYRWSKDDYQKVLDKIAELEKSILHYEDLLANTGKIRTIFKSEVEALRKVKF